MQSNLVAPWDIVVTYPSADFTITGCTPTNGIGIDTTTMTCSIVGNTVTFSSATTDVTLGPILIEGISGTNPATNAATGSFTVDSYNVIGGTQYLVDTFDVTDVSNTDTFQAVEKILARWDFTDLTVAGTSTYVDYNGTAGANMYIENAANPRLFSNQNSQGYISEADTMG